jgi:protease II
MKSLLRLRYLLLVALEISILAAPLSYPPARRADLVENHHGTQVADPYRWMEDLDSTETRAFVVAQAKLTDSYLAEISSREALQQRSTTKNSAPQVTTAIATFIPTTQASSLTPSSTHPSASMVCPQERRC